MSVRVFCIGACLAVLSVASAVQADVSRFIGSYSGEADVISADGSTQHRDMSVEISETKDGFTVTWTSVSYRADGSTKSKAYTVDFLPSEREGIYAAAQTTNVFGHNVQLDPMKGEPYVWGRIAGDTLSVFSLFVTADGGYEMQQFDRTLAEGGLMLEYQAVLNGVVQRTVTTLLKRQ